MNIQGCMKLCKQLKEDGSCSFKEDITNQKCTENPKQCCGICKTNDSCDTKKGVCTVLF